MTKLSIDTESPNFWKRIMGWQEFAILLNGCIQMDCRYVNTERGYIERFRRLPNGRLDCDMKKGRVRTEKVYGKVEIIPAPGDVPRRLLGEEQYWLGVIPLDYRTEYLLTAPYAELMQRQRAKVKFAEASIGLKDWHETMANHG